MKCLIWNVRRVSRTNFCSSFKTLIGNFAIDICVIQEPILSGDRVIAMSKKIGYKNVHLKEACGYPREIWFCWNNDIMNVEVVLSTK